jgi:hypothetical protein
MQHSTAEFYGLVIYEVAVTLTYVKGSADRACDSYSG